MVLPLPVLPMTAVTSPGWAARLTPHSTGSSAPGYWKSTLRNSSSPCIAQSCTGSLAITTLDSVPSTS